MTVATAEDLLLHELKDLYYVEKKLVRVLDDVSNTVEDERLAERLQQHAHESATHAERLEQAFGLLGQEPAAEQCPGFDGIKKEHDDFVSEKPEPAIYDLFVASAAGGRIERYEIAGYSSAVSLAERCGHEDVASLLTETLEEERAMLEDAEALAQQLAAPGLDAETVGDERDPFAGMTVEQLRSEAADRDISGRSSMNKDELIDALSSK